MSVILNFRNLELLSRGLYRHAILLPCAKFHWNRRIGCLVMANFFTNNSAIADRPRVPSCYWIFRQVTQDHSRSFEMTLLSRACVSPYLVPFLRYLASNNGVTLKSGVRVVQCRWIWRRSIDHYTTYYWSAIVSIHVMLHYLTLNNIVTLKSGLWVTQDHWKWHHSKAWIRFHMRLP